MTENFNARRIRASGHAQIRQPAMTENKSSIITLKASSPPFSVIDRGVLTTTTAGQHKLLEVPRYIVLKKVPDYRYSLWSIFSVIDR